MYNKSKDKKAFLRGLYANSRDKLLSQYVREIAARATAEQIGYRFINEAYENNDTANTIANTAEKLGIPGNSSNKGHSNSLSATIEDKFLIFEHQLKNLKQHSQNLDELYNFIAKETVLCIAAGCAILTMFIIPPDKEYLHYIDWSAGQSSPKNLTVEDYNHIVSSDKLFARKIDGDFELIEKMKKNII